MIRELNNHELYFYFMDRNYQEILAEMTLFSSWDRLGKGGEEAPKSGSKKGSKKGLKTTQIELFTNA